HRASSYAPPPAAQTPILSLHDALPILGSGVPTFRICRGCDPHSLKAVVGLTREAAAFIRVVRFEVPKIRDRGRQAGSIHHSNLQDRKSTRLNSSHVAISYAVFCLKKKT